MTNKDKMFSSVLSDEHLMELGNYSLNDIVNVNQGLCSDNYIINVVAQIIDGANDPNVSQKELWKSVNKFLKEEI